MVEVFIVLLMLLSIAMCLYVIWALRRSRSSWRIFIMVAAMAVATACAIRVGMGASEAGRVIFGPSAPR